jgi:hypothetical protein
MEAKMTTLRERLSDLRELASEPSLAINLMHGHTVDNDPFFSRITLDFYRDAMRRHRKFPLVRRFCHGVAVCLLPESFDAYFMSIEAAARRNFKKAERTGFSFSPIDFNQYLDDIARIRRSSDYRQGKVPSSFARDPVKPVSDPVSRSPFHDYRYFGVLREGKLYAYAGCLIAGELCAIEHILGDAAQQADGIVPMLIISIAQYLMDHHPAVRFYAYGSYFGALAEMRRFKRKFMFTPHRVRWSLGN